MAEDKLTWKNWNWTPPWAVPNKGDEELMAAWGEAQADAEQPIAYNEFLNKKLVPSNLRDTILRGVTRATPEKEKAFFSNNPYYGEIIDDTVYINEEKLKAEGSSGDFVSDMFFGEALHNLDKSSPEWYNRLKKAAENDPAVMRWKDESFNLSSGAKNPHLEGDSRTKKDWWKESRFDQVIGGYLLGGKDANVHTMRDWNKDFKGFGTGFKKELEVFRKELGITSIKKGKY